MAKKAASKQAPKKPAKSKQKSRGAAQALQAPSQDKNLCIRKISNGYLVRESSYTRGKYVERETYTATKPKITITNAPAKSS